MAAAVQDLPRNGGKVFAGQIDDPFFVDLGSIFDLAGLRPFNTLHVLPLPTEPGVDGVGGFNTHMIALQVPIEQLTRDGEVHEAGDPEAVLGIYASATRPRVRTLRSNGRVRHSGSEIQVSRLANPLVNEVVIPLGSKDRWNSQDPDDEEAFVQEYSEPEVTQARERPLSGSRQRSRDRTRRPRRDPSHRRPGAQLHRERQGRAAAPEHGHPAQRTGRPGQPARRPRGRLRRVPERPAARGRRHGHRPARLRVRLRPDRRPPDRGPRSVRRRREPIAEQPARRRRGRERSSVQGQLPVRRGAPIRATSTCTTAPREGPRSPTAGRARCGGPSRASGPR